MLINLADVAEAADQAVYVQADVIPYDRDWSGSGHTAATEAAPSLTPPRGARQRRIDAEAPRIDVPVDTGDRTPDEDALLAWASQPAVVGPSGPPPPIPRTALELATLQGSALALCSVVDRRRQQALAGMLATIKWVNGETSPSTVAKAVGRSMYDVQREKVAATDYLTHANRSLGFFLDGVIRTCAWLLREREDPMEGLSPHLELGDRD